MEYVVEGNTADYTTALGRNISPRHVCNTGTTIGKDVEVMRPLRPGVALIAKGLWSRHTRNGSTSNALVPDTLTDLGGGACYNDARVEVERA